ncbi:MAG: UpxY family transcription antiterminator [Bacteroidales bacterium]|nr:UpxY family transcription antiterminator [Bacteroidales bacterium]
MPAGVSNIAKANSVNWYPVRMLYGKAGALKKTLDDGEVEYFYPTHTVEKDTPGGLKYVEEPLIRSLFFIHTTPLGLREIKARFSTSLIPYYDCSESAGARPPLVVPDSQMEQFMRLCRMKEAGLEYLGEDEPKYHQGDRVRVTDGIFKGFEGYIKRIRHDRKLIVTIEGVAAFATRFIPPSMLEKIDN